MPRDSALAGLGLDRVIHERARLVLLTYLASSLEGETGFTELRDELGFSSGNLSVQLKTLEEAGLVAIGKRYRDNKPFTGVRLTVEGERALAAYLAELEVIVASLRGGAATPTVATPIVATPAVATPTVATPAEAAATLPADGPRKGPREES